MSPVGGSTDAETLSVSSEASNSSMPSSSAAAPRQYELPRRRPVSKTVLNKGGRPKKRMSQPSDVVGHDIVGLVCNKCSVIAAVWCCIRLMDDQIDVSK